SNARMTGERLFMTWPFVDCGYSKTRDSRRPPTSSVRAGGLEASAKPDCHRGRLGREKRDGPRSLAALRAASEVVAADLLARGEGQAGRAAAYVGVRGGRIDDLRAYRERAVQRHGARVLAVGGAAGPGLHLLARSRDRRERDRRAEVGRER